MAPLSPTIIAQLQSEPLPDVMEALGIPVAKKKRTEYIYHCPERIHGSRDIHPSFFVRLSPTDGMAYCSYGCAACKNIHGAGAVYLLCDIMGLDRKADFLKACKMLAVLLHKHIEGVDDNTFFRRAEKVVSDNCELSYVPADWSADHLRSLGCKVSQTFQGTDADMDGDAPVYTYSFGDGNVAEEMERMFGVMPIASYLTPQNDKGESWNIKDGTRTDGDSSYNYYPMFVFRYDTDSPYVYPRNDGGWFVRKYEPLARPTGKDERAIKFTWWWQDGRSRAEYLSRNLYGDVDVISALSHGGVSEQYACDERHAPKHIGRLVEKKDAEGNTVKQHALLFERIVICSGPRDAINVYFHSNAHVVWPHSENVDISSAMLRELKNLCEKLYILYDNEPNSKAAALRMQMDFPELHMAELPKDLSTLTSTRTGKPCKDVSEFFECYEALAKQKKGTEFSGIDTEFEILLRQTANIKFWSPQKSRTLNEYNVQEETYEIIPLKLSRFLTVSGYRQYIDESGRSSFVHVADNIVTVINDAEIVRVVKNEAYAWLMRHPYVPVNADRLRSAILSSPSIKRDRIFEYSCSDLNFKGWDDSTDHFYFRNGALRITADGFRLVPYADLQFNVNEAAIVDNSWSETNVSEFSIVYNDELIERKRREIQAMKDAADKSDKRAVERLDKKFADYYSLWAYRLVLPEGKDIEDMSDVFRFIWYMGFVYWRDVDGDHKRLTREQRQFCDMHFINKIGCLGYTLAQERGDGVGGVYQSMGMITDYSVVDKKKAQGRTGKSTFVDLMRLVCNMPGPVDGSHFKTGAVDFAKNFCEFKLTQHRVMPIDDLDPEFDPRQLYTTSKNLKIKTLYDNEYTCKTWESPKLILTSNMPLDTSSASTRGRLYRCYASDYYHEGNSVYDKWDFIRQFGYAIGSKSKPEQLQKAITLLADAVRFWHQTHTIIDAPLEKGGKSSLCRAEVGDYHLCDWADAFFANREVYNCPVPKRDLQILFYRYAREQYVRPSDKAAYDINTKNVNPASLAVFMKQLAVYCKWMDITVNPEEVYRQSDINDRRRIRLTTWHWDFNERGEFVNRRQRDSRVDCVYFYHFGLEPSKTGTPVPYLTNEDIIEKIE